MCYPKNIWDCACFLCCCDCFYQHEDDEGETQDASAASLSYVGQAAYNVLRTKHNRHHHSMWNVTSATVVGELQQTPTGGFPRRRDPGEGHDDWFPQKLYDIMSKTKAWCDVMSLSPPDGLFLTKVKEALACIADRSKGSDTTVIVRMMFGNIVGIPVNCEKVLKELTEGLPQDANMRVWVGAWRKGVSWNHAKIVAVDGRYLHTGGHNMWAQHYLANNPVHDLSFEMQGRVAHDGHRFANQQWNFIKRIQITCCGWIVDKLPDALPLPAKTRVTVSEYPRSMAHIFPPNYVYSIVEPYERLETDVPVISMGRLGTLHWKARPSDDAIVAMLGSAKAIIHMVLQDIGPVCIPGTKIPLPGCVWPKEYLSVLGRVIWEKGVDVEIILSNPGSIPGGLNATEACYGNGWSAVDVAAEIIKTIQEQFPEANDADLRKMVAENLRVCIVSITGPAADNVNVREAHFCLLL